MWVSGAILESLRSGDGILDSDLLGLLTKMELYQRKVTTMISVVKNRYKW